MVYGLDPVGTRLIASLRAAGRERDRARRGPSGDGRQEGAAPERDDPAARRVAVVYDPSVLGMEGYIVAER